MGKRVDAAAAVGGVPIPAPAGRTRKAEAGSFESSLKNARPSAKRPETEPLRTRPPVKTRTEKKKDEAPASSGPSKKAAPAVDADKARQKESGKPVLPDATEQLAERDPSSDVFVLEDGELSSPSAALDFSIDQPFADEASNAEIPDAALIEDATAQAVPLPIDFNLPIAPTSDESGIEEPDVLAEEENLSPVGLPNPLDSTPIPLSTVISPVQSEEASNFEAEEGSSHARPIQLDTMGDLSSEPPSQSIGQAAQAEKAPSPTGSEPSKSPEGEVSSETPVQSEESTELLAKIAPTLSEAPPETAAPQQAADPRLTGAKTSSQPASGGATPLEQRFARENHENIVTAIRSELLPRGGTVRIRLDPPELGALAVRIDIRDGVVAASFETGNEEAAKLLSHSLGQLKQSLESQGVSVEKLHVQQMPKDGGSAANQDSSEHQLEGREQTFQQQEQQRREMLRRMWRRVAGARDEVDVMA